VASSQPAWDKRQRDGDWRKLQAPGGGATIQLQGEVREDCDRRLDCRLLRAVPLVRRGRLEWSSPARDCRTFRGQLRRSLFRRVRDRDQSGGHFLQNANGLGGNFRTDSVAGEGSDAELHGALFRFRKNKRINEDATAIVARLNGRHLESGKGVRFTPCFPVSLRAPRGEDFDLGE